MCKLSMIRCSSRGFSFLTASDQFSGVLTLGPVWSKVWAPSVGVGGWVCSQLRSSWGSSFTHTWSTVSGTYSLPCSMLTWTPTHKQWEPAWCRVFPVQQYDNSLVVHISIHVVCCLWHISFALQHANMDSATSQPKTMPCCSCMCRVWVVAQNAHDVVLKQKVGPGAYSSLCSNMTTLQMCIYQHM